MGVVLSDGEEDDVPTGANRLDGGDPNENLWVDEPALSCAKQGVVQLRGIGGHVECVRGAHCDAANERRLGTVKSYSIGSAHPDLSCGQPLSDDHRSAAKWTSPDGQFGRHARNSFQTWFPGWR
jgi:hypothetical protein